MNQISARPTVLTTLIGYTIRPLHIFLALMFIVPANLMAQQWYRQQGERKNFYEIQQEFNAFMQGKDITTKGLGYKQFKRWEWYWQTRLLPDGSFPSAGSN